MMLERLWIHWNFGSGVVKQKQNGGEIAHVYLQIPVNPVNRKTGDDT